MERQLNRHPLQLAYQSFGQLQGMEAYQSRLEETVRASKSADAEIRLLRLPSAVVAGKGFSSAQALEVPSVLQSVVAAARDGAEAIAIGNGFDPGLWESRELVDIPVLGMFETVTMYGLRVGWRLGVLCSGNAGVARIEELAARYGIGSRLVRPIALGISVPTIVDAFEQQQTADTIGAAVRRAVHELAGRGAEVVIVASGALDIFLRSSGQVAADTEVPVLPSVTILVRELEAAATLARMGVSSVGRAGRFARPPAAVLEAMGIDRR